jgi:hypothetical protein
MSSPTEYNHPQIRPLTCPPEKPTSDDESLCATTAVKDDNAEIMETKDGTTTPKTSMSVVEDAELLKPLSGYDWPGFEQKFKHGLGTVGDETAAYLDELRQLQWVFFLVILRCGSEC